MLAHGVIGMGGGLAGGKEGICSGVFAGLCGAGKRTRRNW